MMQDIPKLFQKEMGSDVNIGFTMFDRWITFSPAKNSLEAGQDAVKGGNTAPGTLSSAESDLYVQNQKKLQSIGVDIPVAEYDSYVPMAKIPVTPGPRIVLCPAFGICRKDYIDHTTGPMKVTERSSLILDGHHITIKGLELDGALILRAGDESYVTVDGLNITNDGWILEELDSTVEYPEMIRIRGYTMNKIATKEYVIVEPGHFVIDSSGTVTKVE
jgi:UDP-sugar pyrophosphorylase